MAKQLVKQTSGHPPVPHFSRTLVQPKTDGFKLVSSASCPFVLRGAWVKPREQGRLSFRWLQWLDCSQILFLFIFWFCGSGGIFCRARSLSAISLSPGPLLRMSKWILPMTLLVLASCTAAACIFVSYSCLLAGHIEMVWLDGTRAFVLILPCHLCSGAETAG